MRKLFYLFIICLFFVGCYNDGTKTMPNTGISGQVVVKEIVYKGHVLVEIKDVGQHGQGWVHDPVCEQNDMKNLIDSINNSKHINLKVNF